MFFQLINARYQHASTVLTSNKDFEYWGEIPGDRAMAAALIDRAHAITVTWSISAATATACVNTPHSLNRKQAHPIQLTFVIRDVDDKKRSRQMRTGDSSNMAPLCPARRVSRHSGQRCYQR